MSRLRRTKRKPTQDSESQSHLISAGSSVKSSTTDNSALDDSDDFVSSSSKTSKSKRKASQSCSSNIDDNDGKTNSATTTSSSKTFSALCPLCRKQVHNVDFVETKLYLFLVHTKPGRDRDTWLEVRWLGPTLFCQIQGPHPLTILFCV